MPSMATGGSGQCLPQMPAGQNVGAGGQDKKLELGLSPQHAVVAHRQGSGTAALPCPLDQPTSYPCNSPSKTPQCIYFKLGIFYI